MAQFFNDTFTSATTVDVTAHTSTPSGHTWVMVKGAVVPKVFSSGALGSGGANAVNTPSIARASAISPTADSVTNLALHYDSVNFICSGPAVRLSADGSSGYVAILNQNSKLWTLHRLTSGASISSQPILAQSAAITYVAGNEVNVSLEAKGVGASVTVSLKLNGVDAFTPFVDTDAARVVTPGYPGVAFQSGTAAGTGVWYLDMSADTIEAQAATAPAAPTVGTVTAGDGTVTVPFTLNGDGGSAITSVTATVTPGGQFATGTTSPLVITGVANGTAVTAKAKATNAVGPGPESAASNSVTPSASVTVTSVTVSPSAPTVIGGSSQQFTATVTGTGAVPQGVTWAATGGGTITAGGLYTAPATTGSVQNVTVTATSTTDATKSGSAAVTIPAAVAITVSGVTVSPAAPTVSGGATQQFSATVAGTGAVPQTVTWTATPGTITAGGLYTAPASTASVQSATVTATSTQDVTKSGSATVTVPAAVAAPAAVPGSTALKFADRVKDTTTTTGTGNITLANVAIGIHQPFGAAFAAGTKNIPYCIQDQDGTGTLFEAGVGTLVSATVFRRDTVYSSSNAGALVNFGPNTKDVACIVPARAFSTFAVKDYIDLRDYDVDPTFTNDSTAGIQAAIFDAHSKRISKIKAPDGRFKIAGPKGVSNAQLYIPVTRSNEPSRTILFEGASPPCLEMQGLVSMPVTTNGTIFESTIQGGTGWSLLRGEAGDNNDVSGMGWNYTNVGFRNMGFRTKVDGPNGTGLANTMTALNLRDFSQIVELDNIRVDVNMPIIACPNPTSVNSSGIILPPVNNHAQFNVGSLLIAGYTNGLVIGEHTHVKSVIVLGCVNAVDVPIGNHGSMISHLLVECSQNSIRYQNNHPLMIGCYSTEHNNDGNWFDFVSDINCTAATAPHRKVVIVQSTVIKSHAGNSDTGFTTFGHLVHKVFVGAGAN